MSADCGGTYTQIDAADLDNKPFLRGQVVTSGLGSLGSTYLFKLTAINEIGSNDSLPRVVVFATVSAKPANPPSQDLSFTSKSQIKVRY